MPNQYDSMGIFPPRLSTALKSLPRGPRSTKPTNAPPPLKNRVEAYPANHTTLIFNTKAQRQRNGKETSLYNVECTCTRLPPRTRLVQANPTSLRSRFFPFRKLLKGETFRNDPLSGFTSLGKTGRLHFFREANLANHEYRTFF